MDHTFYEKIFRTNILRPYYFSQISLEILLLNIWSNTLDLILNILPNLYQAFEGELKVKWAVFQLHFSPTYYI